MSTFRLIVTGHRRVTAPQARFVRATLGRLWLPLSAIHDHLIVVDGACPYGGVDAVAYLWADERQDCTSERHPMEPATEPWQRKAAGPRRNQRMVDLGAHLCMGFPGLHSHGTWDCLQRAVDAGIPSLMFPLPEPGRIWPVIPTLEVR